MRVKLEIFLGLSKTPVVSGELEGDPQEIIDMYQELNARWPGRRAELTSLRDNSLVDSSV